MVVNQLSTALLLPTPGVHNRFMENRLKLAEAAIFLSAIVLIFVSEYYYIVLKNPTKAIFLGLWPPTILLVLVYANLKLKK